jgi:uncharacterized SAM-binding protein YcdF (DUF218 family)
MFFYVSKVGWFLVQPSSLVLLAPLVALWAHRTGRHVLAYRAMMGAAVVAVVGLSPLANLLALPLEQRFARADLSSSPVTGFIVLGGGEDAPVALARKAHALNEAGERISEAVALARRYPEARVVFTGGSGFLFPGGETEGAAVRDMLLSMGVAPEKLTIEENARTTFENALFTRDLVKPVAGERWIMITSAWHMPRSMGIFRKAGFAVEPWPVDYRTIGWEDGLHTFASPAEGLKRLDTMAKEYAGLLALWLTGRSSALFPAPCTAAPTCS